MLTVFYQGPNRIHCQGKHVAVPAAFHAQRNEFAWRTTQLFDAIGSGVITVIVSGRYPLKDAAQAHRDLQDRKTVGSVVITP
jgi:NADPH2:quinone reductase